MKYIDRFLLHYQLIDMNNCILLWKTILKFQETNYVEVALTARAWLLYQKFIDRQSYIFIPFILDAVRDRLKKTITAAMNEDARNEDRINGNVFNEVMSNLESELTIGLFQPFLKSEYYQNYQSAMTLTTALQTETEEIAL